nr:hypothetical protein [uncultured Roseateles sp.]
MKCIVNPGHQIRRQDGTLAGPGDEVEIADEVLAANPGAATEVKGEAEAPTTDTPEA